MWVGKFDPTGQCIWLRGAQSDPSNIWGSHAFSIDTDNSGGVYIGGKFCELSINFGAITLTKTATYDYTANMFILKYDSNGQEQWAYNAGTTYQNLTYAYAIKTDNNDNVYVGGFFSNSITLGGITLNALGGSKAYIVKFDSGGTALWGKTIDGFNCGENLYSFDTDTVGNLYVAGMTSCASLNFGNGVTASMSGEGGIYVAKYNPAGTAQWARQSGSTNINNIVSIDCYNENQIYVAGTFFSPTLPLGPLTLTKSSSNYDLFIAKLNYTPLGTDEFVPISFNAYPNPFNEQIMLATAIFPCQYSVYDMAGKKVLEGSISAENQFLNTSMLEAGIYIFHTIDATGNADNFKAVKM